MKILTDNTFMNLSRFSLYAFRIFIYSFIGLFAYLSFALFVPPAYAQGSQPATGPLKCWSGQGFGSAMDTSCNQGSVNSDAYINDLTNKNMASIACSIIPYPGPNGCSNDPARLRVMMNNSAIGMATNTMAFLYSHPPAQTSVFVRDLGQTLGFLPKSAEAQGIGFTGLSTLLPLWKAFRNVAYGLMAIIISVIGFMVMLRKKIDPKTVVTVQNALPRIVIALILVTFSYAIVGLAVDLMYFVMILGLRMLISAVPNTFGPEEVSFYTSGGIWNLWWGMFGTTMRSWDDVMKLLSWNNGYGFVGGVSAVINTIVYGWWLIPILLAVMVLIGYIRILFMLISAYIQIIIALIVSPLQLVAEALPGTNVFAGWLGNLVANLSVFPITAIMIVIGRILTSADPTFGASKLWTPPLLGTGGSAGYTGLIGLGILFTIPSVAGAVKELLKAKPAVNAGPGAILGPLASGGGMIFQTLYQGSFVWNAFRHKTDERSRLEQVTNTSAPKHP